MLHGEIKVNNTVIGEWKAVRKTRDLRDFNEYDCTVTYRDMQGYPCEAKWTIYGQGYGNGAVSLAARVLTEAVGKLERIQRTQEEDTIWLMNRMMNP